METKKQSQHVNTDAQEWVEALENTLLSDGKSFSEELLAKVIAEAKNLGLNIDNNSLFPFKNSVSKDFELDYPGDLDERYVIFPAQQPHPSPVEFTDVAALKGVDKTDRGRGVSWVDLNGDGLLDLFTVGIDTPHGLFLQSGQSFQSPSDRSALDQIPGGWAAIAADYDGDGDSDLYVTRNAWEGGGPNSLYQNDGKGHFVDRATTSGVVDPDDSFTAAWGDIDGDGWLDLYVADGVTGSGAANKLFVLGIAVPNKFVVLS